MDKYIIVPVDAYEILTRRFSTLEKAIIDGKEAVINEGMSIYILELKAVVERASPPIRAKKI